jgi:hypothetical protein
MHLHLYITLERAGEKAEHGDKIYIMIDTTTTREKQ